MDPTISFGELTAVSAKDMQVFDVIGYHTLPEPGGAAGILLATGFAMRRPRPK